MQGLLIPFFLKLQLPILDGWFLAALNCFAGGVFLTFGENIQTQDLSNFLALPWATCRSSILCTLLLFLLGCAPVFPVTTIICTCVLVQPESNL